MNPIVQLDSISRIYTNGYVKQSALNSVSLSVFKGDFVAVTGPSGSGKSTLLNIMGFIDRPSDGNHSFLGQDITSKSLSELNTFRRNHIGFVLQSYALIETYTVKQNIELPLRYLKVKGSERKQRIASVVQQLGIQDKLSNYPYQLSIGQIQRAAIARAIVTNPDLLLADEPTGALDTTNSNQVIEIFRQLNQQGTTIVLVTHNDAIARSIPKQIHLVDGKVQYSILCS